MSKIYGTSVIPGDIIEVLAGGTVDISLAFNTVVGIVGGMDTANGSKSTGDVYNVPSPSDAADFFGDGSELHNQVKLAYNQGVSEVWAYPVDETSVTGESAGGQSGTLSNTPVFDPNVNTEHSISATDSGGTDPDVNIVYEDTVSTPSDSDTVNVNPVTGDFEFDAAAAGSYEFDYSYGTYDSTVFETILNKDIRFLGVCTENESVINTAQTEASNDANDFDFHRVVGGILPNPDPSNYSDNLDDQRVVAGMSRGKIDSSTEVRTMGAISGVLATKPLGQSATGPQHGKISGLTEINPHASTPLTNSELGTLTDKQVLPLKDGVNIHIVKDMTTSTNQKFERVYAAEVADEIAEASHRINQSFIGDQNVPSTQENIEDSHRSMLDDASTDNPPQLGNPDGTQPYSVNVSGDSSNDNEVDVELGIDIVDVVDTIDVTITVGDVAVSGNDIS